MIESGVKVRDPGGCCNPRPTPTHTLTLIPSNLQSSCPFPQRPTSLVNSIFCNECNLNRFGTWFYWLSIRSQISKLVCLWGNEKCVAGSSYSSLNTMYFVFVCTASVTLHALCVLLVSSWPWATLIIKDSEYSPYTTIPNLFKKTDKRQALGRQFQTGSFV